VGSNEIVYGSINATVMKVFIGSDRVGFDLKCVVASALAAKGWAIVDLGPHVKRSTDYPVVAEAVARAVAETPEAFGILVCESGAGMCIVANKVKSVRAVNCSNLFLARQARLHNDANIACLGSAIVSMELAVEIIFEFLSKKFEGGKHVKRVDMINNL
jgi:ribose 5-phosphate isomerase B